MPAADFPQFIPNGNFKLALTSLNRAKIAPFVDKFPKLPHFS